MSYGLRVWDASGNLTLDVTDRLTRFVTSATVYFTTSSNEADKYISIAGMQNDGTWFVSSSAFQAQATVEVGRVAVKKLTSQAPVSTVITVFKI